MHNNEFTRIFLTFISVLTNILSVIFWILLLFGFEAPYVAVLSIVAAILHECGHEIYIIMKKGHSGRVYGRVFGFRIKPGGFNSYKEDIGMKLWGPLANLAGAGVAVMLLPLGVNGQYCRMAAAVNVMTALSNLLPIRGYDGYGVLRALLERDGRWGGVRVLNAVSTVLTAVACAVSLYMMARIGEGYWVFAVFYASLFSSLFGQKWEKTRF